MDLSLLLLVVLSFVLGFARDLVIVWQFGSGWHTDVLFVALIMPTLFENLLGLALRDSMVPYLVRLRSTSRADYGAAARQLYRLSVWIGGGLTLTMTIGASWWLSLLAPGWSPAQISAAAGTFIVAALLIATHTVLYCQTALLNVEGIFILPMWRTITLNVTAIGAVLIWPGSILSVVWGMLAGQVLSLLIMHHALSRHIVAVDRSIRIPFVRLWFLGNFMPLLLATGMQQASVIAERYFGSLLEPGSITVLSLAFRTATIPLTLFALSVMGVLYPKLAGTWVKSDLENFRMLIQKLANLAFVFLIPASAFMLSKPDIVIGVLLERGQFGAIETAATAPLLAIFSAGLPAMGIALFGGRILLAQQQGRFFAFAAFVSAAATIAMDWALYGPLGAPGLAAAFAVGSWIQAILVMVLLSVLCPVSFAVGPWVRWAVTAAAVFGALRLIPLPETLLGLSGGVLLAMLSSMVLVRLLGERNLFSLAYWSAGVAEARQVNRGPAA